MYLKGLLKINKIHRDAINTSYVIFGWYLFITEYPHPISSAKYLHLPQWFSTTSEQIRHSTVGAEVSWRIFLNLYRNYKSTNHAQVAKWKFHKTQGKWNMNTRIPKLNTSDTKGKEILVPEDEGGGSLTQVRGTVVTRWEGRNQHNGQGSYNTT